MDDQQTLTLRDMRFMRELAKALAHLRPLHEAAAVLRHKDFHFDDLSREIIRLETRMGVAHGFLVDSTPKKGSIITKQGRDAADAMGEVYDLYQHKFASLIPDMRKRVTVGMTNSATAYLLSGIFGKGNFLRDNPNTDFKVLEGEAEDLQHYLRSFEVDFALAQELDTLPGVIREPLCRWRRILLYQKGHKQFERLSELPACGEPAMLHFLQGVTVLIPLRRVMPEVERWLHKPTTGRVVKLPQAAIRREWARQGLGVAVVHHEPQLHAQGDDHLAWVELPPRIGWTKMCFYFRGRDEKRDALSSEAESLAGAIRDRYGKAAVP